MTPSQSCVYQTFRSFSATIIGLFFLLETSNADSAFNAQVEPLMAQDDSSAVQLIDGGVTLSAKFQDIQGTLTSRGMTIKSTSRENSLPDDAFWIQATSIGRTSGQTEVRLAETGQLNIGTDVVQFFRPELVEEYTASMNGIRQDFLVQSAPEGIGNLVLEITVKNGEIAQLDNGVQILFTESLRELAYHQLLVTDRLGHTLQAHFNVPSSSQLQIIVDDMDATYPIRIDPTFSDADWISMSGFPGANDNVNALIVDGSGNLYAGGNFTAIGSTAANYVAMWDGSEWSSLGVGVDSTVRALAINGNDIYVGGDFDMAGGSPANYIARWNGTTWSALGSGMSGDALTSVRALAVVGDDLYAGGFFDDAGAVTANGIAKWDGSNWSALGSGVGASSPFPFALVASLAVSGTDLYVGGEFGTADGVTVNNIAKWNGAAWSPLGSGMAFGSEPFASVAALAISGNDVYAGGLFTEAGGVSANYVAKWNGLTWSALGSGIDGQGEVNALTLVNDNLYVGGSFTMAGGVAVNNIASWDGFDWSALGSGTDGPVIALATSGTDIYVGGNFTMAGGKISPYLALAQLVSNNGPYVVFANGQATVYLRVPTSDEYQIQRSLNVTPESWTNIGTVPATTGSTISFVDSTPPAGDAYYRAVRTGP